MTNSELIHKIIDIYSESRKSIFPSAKIKRIKSHTSSSATEDLIAYFFSTLIDDEIIVDNAFRVKKSGKSKIICPDIAIKKGNIVTHFFDIKMDLGWKRFEFPNYCIEKNEIIKEIRGQFVDYWGHELKISDEIQYEIIVISSLNIPTKMLAHNIKMIEEAKIEDTISVYFLTTKIHPNHGDSDFAKLNIEIHHSELDKLRERIKIP